MEGENGKSMQGTPTYATATILFIFVLVSLLIERGLHRLGKLFKKHKKKALVHTLEKMKEELMLLGFISLLLTVFQGRFSKMCVPSNTAFAHHFTLCPYDEATTNAVEPESPPQRRLLSRLDLARATSDWVPDHWRVLAETATEVQGYCEAGKEPFVSSHAVHQVHLFLFSLAITHMLYSIVVMGLAKLKVKGWKVWEDEAQSGEAHEPLKHLKRFRARHSSYWGNAVLDWVACFFRQFYRILSKTDYKAMRVAFVTYHKTTANFDFHNYIMRSLEDDFIQIVGISEYMWLLLILYIWFDVPRNYYLVWLPYFILLIMFAVGTKLMRVVQVLARDVDPVSVSAQGAVELRPRDSLFWFARPRILLHILHFVLFSASYQLAAHAFYLVEYGWHACYFELKGLMIARVLVELVLVLYVSYGVLPLYAVVSQMGTHYKKSIFSDNVQGALGRWVGSRKKKEKGVVDQVVLGVAAGLKSGVEGVEKVMDAASASAKNSLVRSMASSRGEKSATDTKGTVQESESGGDYTNDLDVEVGVLDERGPSSTVLEERQPLSPRRRALGSSKI